MISAAVFIEHLRNLGYSQFVGVPCSFLKPFINFVISDDRLDYMAAASEGEAVGIAFGAYLAGQKTVVMCQNSGLGNTVNPLTSLNYPFRVPTLLIVTWRGQSGLADEPQHEQMGQITTELCETLDIPWEMFPAREAEIDTVMQKAEATMQESQRPFALIMPKGSVEPFALSQHRHPTRVNTHYEDLAVRGKDTERLMRTEALQVALRTLRGDEAIIATTGKTGRELFTLADRPNHLYVVGGMGTASAIALGIAHALPSQPVVVFDGDGAALMKMGTFATIGYYHPKNLIHVLLDNEQHDSTGGQFTASPVVDFARIAAATNYRYAVAVDDAEHFEACLDQARTNDGPSFIHLKIRPGSPSDLGRPTVKPYEVKDRFRDFLSRGQ